MVTELWLTERTGTPPVTPSTESLVGGSAPDATEPSDCPLQAQPNAQSAEHIANKTKYLIFM